jgi:hypothetical protein
MPASAGMTPCYLKVWTFLNPAKSIEVIPAKAGIFV